MSAGAMIDENLKINLSRSNISGQFLSLKTWEVNKNWKVQIFSSIPENPLTTKVGQRKLGGYWNTVYFSDCCFFGSFKEVCVWKKIIHQI